MPNPLLIRYIYHPYLPSETFVSAGQSIIIKTKIISHQPIIIIKTTISNHLSVNIIKTKIINHLSIIKTIILCHLPDLKTETAPLCLEIRGMTLHGGGKARTNIRSPGDCCGLCQAEAECLLVSFLPDYGEFLSGCFELLSLVCWCHHYGIIGVNQIATIGDFCRQSASLCPFCPTMVSLSGRYFELCGFL